MIRTTIRHWLLHTAIDHLFSNMYRLLVSPKEAKQFVLDKMYDGVTVNPNFIGDDVTILDAYYTGIVFNDEGKSWHVFTSDRVACNKSMVHKTQMWCNEIGYVHNIMDTSIICFDSPIEFYIEPHECI